MRRSILAISLLLFFCADSFAQLCQGSLGDPIINITFGSGPNPGPPLAAATTSYQYVSTDCPNDGYYTVRNSTANCFGNSWHNLNSDHTGGLYGYFMLVNASYQPSAFYLDTVHGLCGATTYEFAAWIMNVLLPQTCNGAGIQPNITFQIEKTDGSLLQSYNSGNIPATASPMWNQYGFFFATPPGVSDVVVRMINNSQGGCGNDLALDDITFRPCGPQLNPSIVGIGADTANICEGTAQTFTFNCSVSAGFNNPSFQWQRNFGSGWVDIPGANTTTYTSSVPANTLPGTYSYRLTVSEGGNINLVSCRIASTPLAVIVNRNPVPNASTSSPVCERKDLVLTANDGTQYSWTGPNGFSSANAQTTIGNVQVSQSGKYYVLVTNAAGCSKRDSVIVSVNPAPSAITAFADIKLCEGDSVILSGNGGGTYLWSPATGLSAANIANPKASPAVTTDYMLIVTNQFNCKDTAYSKVNVIKLPVANAGPDKVTIEGRPVQLQGTATGDNIVFSWLPPLYMDDPSILTPKVSPPSDYEYYLSVVSNEGCGVDIDTVFVKVYKKIGVPNAFTPNNDGINDRWNVPALKAFTDVEVKVFNRFGKMVYHATNDYNGWDGSYNGIEQPSGTYVYLIDIKELPLRLTGTVTLLR